MSNRVVNILVPIVSVIVGLIVGAIVMVASGYSPTEGYIALWNGIFGDSYTIGESIRQITPYILSGLAVAFAFRTGLFNIGVEGQLLAGWTAAAYVESITDYSRLHWGIIVALLMVAVMWFILDKTTRGYELKAVGFNSQAAEYSGMNVKKNIILAMTISGVFAGLAGAMEALGTFEYASTKGGFTGIGFDGIAVALLGANTPLG
ncbi:hypothetical protein RhiirA1_404873, partial [Rhizophagus irregularis]